MPMSWTKVGEFYGLKKPFNFNVAIPFLLNGCMLILVLVVCAFLFWNGALNIGTARFYFFLYITCLLVIAAVFSRARRLSYPILCWCTIELGLALGSNILAKHKAVPSLFPENVTRTDDLSFMYHPLLQTVPRPNFHYTDHLDFAGIEDNAKASGIDVASLQGQELEVVHNSLGLRGKELTADDLAKNLIFVYGGSTTYDVGITQGETWVERLQSDLDDKYTILNLGVPAHTTVEHLIQTAFYQDIVGKKPVCAIYYVGWNDTDEAHIEHMDSAYADSNLLRNAERRPRISLSKYSPLLFLANGLAVSRFDTVPLPPQRMRKVLVAGSDPRLEAIFTEHIKTIVAINAARGIRTIFIGQIFNRNWPANVPETYVPLVRGQDLIPLLERLKSIAQNTAPSAGAKYIDAGNTNFVGSDFVDSVHFSASGAKKFAALVSGDIDDSCR